MLKCTQYREGLRRLDERVLPRLLSLLLRLRSWERERRRSFERERVL